MCNHECVNANRHRGDDVDDWIEGPCGENPGKLLAEIERLRQKLANTHWDADCHVDGERGENTCRLEGTHICMVCRLVDDRREIKRLQGIVGSLLEIRTYVAQQLRYGDLPRYIVYALDSTREAADPKKQTVLDSRLHTDDCDCERCDERQGRVTYEPTDG